MVNNQEDRHMNDHEEQASHHSRFTQHYGNESSLTTKGHLSIDPTDGE